MHVSQGFSNAFYYITSLLSEKHIECHACANLFNYPAILHLFKCSNRHLKLLLAQKSRKYTTPKLWDGYWRITSVLLPYEFTLLQNLKRGLKLLPVYVSQDIKLHFIISRPFFRKTYCLPYLCKFVQLPCCLAPLQTLEKTSEVATGAKVTQTHYSKTTIELQRCM